MFWIVFLVTFLLWLVALDQLTTTTPWVPRGSFAASLLLFVGSTFALVFEAGFKVGLWVAQ